jgi:hypothetical protein
MFDCLSLSITSTRDRLHFEHFSSMQKVCKFYVFRTNLRRQRAFRFFQLIMQFESLLVYVLALRRDQIEDNFFINRSIDFSLFDVMLFDLTCTLLDKFIMIEQNSKTICSRNE